MDPPALPPADAVVAVAAVDPAAAPPYDDMILAAVASLNSADGSSKKMISDFIQQTHPDQLPPNHDALLTQHLQTLKAGGRIVLVKNSYRLPDPAGSVSRPKRGRPAKSKPVADLAANPVVLGLADEEPAAPKRASGRGRPPKRKASGPMQEEAAAAPPANGAGRPKRGRGRPPKVTVVPFASETAAVTKPKVMPKVKAGRVEKLPVKRRGRPPKSNTTAAPSGSSAAAPQPHCVEYELLQNKVEVIQTRIKDAVGILKPHLAGEGATKVMAAIVELEAIAALDIRAPLKADTDATQS